MIGLVDPRDHAARARARPQHAAPPELGRVENDLIFHCGCIYPARPGRTGRWSPAGAVWRAPADQTGGRLASQVDFPLRLPLGSGGFYVRSSANSGREIWNLNMSPMRHFET
jgi:hypothetical protein